MLHVICSQGAVVYKSQLKPCELSYKSSSLLKHPLRILDGNCLAPTDHRLKVLRPHAAAALPGKTLVQLGENRIPTKPLILYPYKST